MTTQRQMSAGVLLKQFSDTSSQYLSIRHTASCARIPHSVRAGCTRIEDIPREKLMINLTVLERIL